MALDWEQALKLSIQAVCGAVPGGVECRKINFAERDKFMRAIGGGAVGESKGQSSMRKSFHDCSHFLESVVGGFYYGRSYIYEFYMHI